MLLALVLLALVSLGGGVEGFEDDDIAIDECSNGTGRRKERAKFCRMMVLPVSEQGSAYPHPIGSRFCLPERYEDFDDISAGFVFGFGFDVV